METYTKINTLYKRYQHIGKKDCPSIPNEAWRGFANQIIHGKFSDSLIEDIKNIKLDASEKVDGTNSKIAFYPSSGTFKVGGKTDNAQSMKGQFEYLTEIAERILPIMKDLFPKECARFVPVKDDETRLPKKLYSVDNGGKEYDGGVFAVPFEEVPIYLYGEFYGNGIQSGGYYRNDRSFALFDINQQGWWLPRKEFNDLAAKLKIPTTPYLGEMTILEAEEMVRKGFPTAIGSSGHLAEGIVLKHPRMRDGRGNRIIVKIKHCDYEKYDKMVNNMSADEFNDFNEWYSKTIESNV